MDFSYDISVNAKNEVASPQKFMCYVTSTEPPISELAG